MDCREVASSQSLFGNIRVNPKRSIMKRETNSVFKLPPTKKEVTFYKREDIDLSELKFVITVHKGRTILIELDEKSSKIKRAFRFIKGSYF